MACWQLRWSTSKLSSIVTHAHAHEFSSSSAHSSLFQFKITKMRSNYWFGSTYHLHSVICIIAGIRGCIYENCRKLVECHNNGKDKRKKKILSREIVKQLMSNAWHWSKFKVLVCPWKRNKNVNTNNNPAIVEYKSSWCNPMQLRVTINLHSAVSLDARCLLNQWL